MSADFPVQPSESLVERIIAAIKGVAPATDPLAGLDFTPTCDKENCDLDAEVICWSTRSCCERKTNSFACWAHWQMEQATYRDLVARNRIGTDIRGCGQRYWMADCRIGASPL